MVYNHSIFSMLLMLLMCPDMEKEMVKQEKKANYLPIITKK